MTAERLAQIEAALAAASQPQATGAALALLAEAPAMIAELSNEVRRSWAAVESMRQVLRESGAPEPSEIYITLNEALDLGRATGLKWTAHNSLYEFLKRLKASQGFEVRTKPAPAGRAQLYARADIEKALTLSRRGKKLATEAEPSPPA